MPVEVPHLPSQSIPQGALVLIVFACITLGLLALEATQEIPRVRFFGAVFWGTYGIGALVLHALFLLILIFALVKQWHIQSFFVLLYGIVPLLSDIISYARYVSYNISANFFLYILSVALSFVTIWYGLMLTGAIKQTPFKEHFFVVSYCFLFLLIASMRLLGII